MELIGTFALCYVGGQSIRAGTGDLTVPALTHGLVLGLMIYGGAHLSGAHFNPAVTVGLMLIRKCEVLEGLFFMLFQLCGGIIAGAQFLAMDGTGNDDRCWCPSWQEKTSWWKAVVFELVATWFLMMAIMGTAVDNRAPKGVFGVAIGGMLAVNILAIGNFTGGALNPTRMIGPSIGSGHFLTTKFLEDFWVYLLGPFLGAIAAAFMWQFVFYNRADDEKVVVVQAEVVVESELQTNLVYEKEVYVERDTEVGNYPPIVVVDVDLSVLTRAPPVENEIKWQGHFFQNDEKFDMEFKHMIY